VRCCLRHPTFSRSSRPTCDRRTDRQTDTERKLKLILALASVARVKITVVYGGEEFLTRAQQMLRWATVATIDMGLKEGDAVRLSRYLLKNSTNCLV